MASYDILIPPLEGYEEAQNTVGIEPEQLAVLGLAQIDTVRPPHAKNDQDGASEYGYGYVMPYTHRNKNYYLRGLYPCRDDQFESPMPEHASDLSDRLIWHQAELQQLQSTGIKVPPHLPVIVTNHERWGQGRSALFTLVESVEEPNTSLSLDSYSARKQVTAYEVIRRVFAYYTDENRTPDVPCIYDICYTKQYCGMHLVDLDPYIYDSEALIEHELSGLAIEASKLRSRAGKQLYEKIQASITTLRHDQE